MGLSENILYEGIILTDIKVLGQWFHASWKRYHVDDFQHQAQGSQIFILNFLTEASNQVLTLRILQHENRTYYPTQHVKYVTSACALSKTTQSVSVGIWPGNYISLKPTFLLPSQENCLCLEPWCIRDIVSEFLKCNQHFHSSPAPKFLDFPHIQNLIGSSDQKAT